MASVSITEKEYGVLAELILELADKGRMEEANVLDRLAKKANQSLTRAKYIGFMHGNFVAQSPLETRADLMKRVREKSANT